LLRGEELVQIKVLADAHPAGNEALNRRAVLAEAIASREILFHPFGFLHFHHRQRQDLSLPSLRSPTTAGPRHGSSAYLCMGKKNTTVGSAVLQKLH